MIWVVSLKETGAYFTPFPGAIKGNDNKKYCGEAGQNEDHDSESAFLIFESVDYLLVRDIIPEAPLTVPEAGSLDRGAQTSGFVILFEAIVSFGVAVSVSWLAPQGSHLVSCIHRHDHTAYQDSSFLSFFLFYFPTSLRARDVRNDRELLCTNNPHNTMAMPKSY